MLTMCLALGCGTLAALWARPIQRHAERYAAIFRKPWMKLPILGTAFACGVLGGSQVPSRILHKLSPSHNTGVDYAHYTGTEDVVSRFRLFETMHHPNPKGEIADYLSTHSKDATRKSELTTNILMKNLQSYDPTKLFRVQRKGKDKDDIFYTFGKIHGLENIAFVGEEELRNTQGNPVRIQKLVNRVSSTPLKIDSYEHLVELTVGAAERWRQTVD